MIRSLTMVLIGVAAALALSSSTCRPALADPPAPYADRALRFVPPANYEAVPVPSVDLSQQAHLTTIAAYVRNRGRGDQFSILIMMELHEGSLGEFESAVENELRGQIDGLFVSKKELTRLSNGMPAYWLKLAFGEGFDSMQQYMYVAVDGRRGVTVSVTGHLGVINEDNARDALKNLALVLYP
jgi:hypothetical protein